MEGCPGVKVQDRAHVLTRHSSSCRDKRSNHSSKCSYYSAHISRSLLMHSPSLSRCTSLSMDADGSTTPALTDLDRAYMNKQDAVEKYVMERYWGDTIC